MKLISLYIENFGGLRQYALDLENGLTVIEEANGFGKTTLAEFIRAMFYGFPRKAKTLDKSRRQKYTPWNGGKFGGNLVFEVDGGRYRVERSFGATPKGDSFTLIDLATNKKSNRYSEELGLELFQLDADSFERSTYLPQSADGQVLTTDSIRSKLTDLVEDTNDVGNFEKALAALKARRSAFIPYRGSGGSVMQANSCISQLQEQLRQAENRKEDLEATEIHIQQLLQQQAGLENSREQVRREIRQASEAAAAAAVHQQYDRMAARQEELKTACDALRAKYPAGIPEQPEIEAARNAAAQLEILSCQVVTEQEDLEAQAFLEAKHSRFEAHIPTAEELAGCREWCRQLSGLRERTMGLAAAAARHPDRKMNPWPMILLFLLGAAGTVLGAVLLGQEALWGGIALGTGAAALAGGVFAAVRLAAVRKQLQRFHQEQLEARAELNRLTAQAEGLTARIEHFLGAYAPVEGADFYGLLAELEHSSGDYLRAKNRVAQWQQEKAAHEEKTAHWNSVLDGFFADIGLKARPDVRAQLLEIRDDRKDWEEASEAADRGARELDAFRQANTDKLSQPVPEKLADPEELKGQEASLTVQLAACTEELLRSQQRRELLRSQVQQIPELREELQQWQEKKAADQKKSDLLDDTMSLLEQARENLSNSYLGPIQASFAGYLEKLWENQEGQVLVTPDLDVQLERFGAARELGYFSAGQTDVVTLCMRLALVDALFGAEKPFVILDDPFINLDDTRTAQALELLKNLSQDRQIIYLTCNSSRTPK